MSVDEHTKEFEIIYPLIKVIDLWQHSSLSSREQSSVEIKYGSKVLMAEILNMMPRTLQSWPKGALRDES